MDAKQMANNYFMKLASIIKYFKIILLRSSTSNIVIQYIP